MTTTPEVVRDGPVVATRPSAGSPRRYDFPAVSSHRLANGLALTVVDLPGRPLVSATMLIQSGAVEDPSDRAGATVLAARAASEGTEAYDAIALVEASERLGASLHSEAGWDAVSVGVDVPADRLADALALVAEVLLRPTFPADEVERLRDERLNDLLQAAADPRRRVEEAFIETIYAASSPYHRPAGGTRETVEGLDSEVLRARWAGLVRPELATLVVGGDLGGLDVETLAADLFGGRPSSIAGALRAIDDTASPIGRIVRVIHRPGAVQTEIRIGHRGLARRIPDFHAVSVMSAILGGLFNSRLNLKLREEKGYTYGAGAGFDMRRGAGPFAARAAVNTEVTVPAIVETIAELRRMRETPVSTAELTAARDFLVGVFPLRFETAGAVVGALGSLAIHGLDVEELVGYRGRIEAVDVEAVLAAAGHIDLDGSAIVLVGDVDAFGTDLEGAGLGRIVIEGDEVRAAPLGEAADGTPGPIDADDSGPTAGAEEPPDDLGDRPTEPEGG